MNDEPKKDILSLEELKEAGFGVEFVDALGQIKDSRTFHTLAFLRSVLTEIQCEATLDRKMRASSREIELYRVRRLREAEALVRKAFGMQVLKAKKQPRKVIPLHQKRSRLR